jgi:hypothetical protein
MNMLIAVMSDTYANVQDGAEENKCKEKIILMSDHLWLVSLQEKFKNQKYILIVKPRNDFNETLLPI